MVDTLPKRMRYKSGVYYFVSFDGKWNVLGRDISKALENYLHLYGDSCPDDSKDVATELYLAKAEG